MDEDFNVFWEILKLRDNTIYSLLCLLGSLSATIIFRSIGLTELTEVFLRLRSVRLRLVQYLNLKLPWFCFKDFWSNFYFWKFYILNFGVSHDNLIHKWRLHEKKKKKILLWVLDMILLSCPNESMWEGHDKIGIDPSALILHEQVSLSCELWVRFFSLSISNFLCPHPLKWAQCVTKSCRFAIKCSTWPTQWSSNLSPFF